MRGWEKLGGLKKTRPVGEAKKILWTLTALAQKRFKTKLGENLPFPPRGVCPHRLVAAPPYEKNPRKKKKPHPPAVWGKKKLKTAKGAPPKKFPFKTFPRFG